MRSVLILGYYGKNNLGDDLFQYAITQIVKLKYPTLSLTFANPKDISRIPGSPEIIFVGGGDLINDYFMDSLRHLLKDVKCPVYGIGIGFPYPNLITKEYLDIFDIIITRTKLHYPKLVEVMPGRSFYGPDLVRFLPNAGHKNSPNRIGIFFANSICPPDSPLVQKLASIVTGIAEKRNSCFGPKYIVTLYAMNTSGFLNEDDNVLNRAVYKACIAENVEIMEQPLTIDMIIPTFTSFYATICTRYHAHVLSLMTETPFISLYSTEKVKDLLQTEELIQYGHQMIVDHQTLKPLDFNSQDVLNKFKHLEDNWSSYRKDLAVKRPDLTYLQRGIENLFFYKPKFGIKRFNRIMCKIFKYLKAVEYPNLEKEDLSTPGFFVDKDSDFVSEVVTFCVDRKDNSDFTWGLKTQINDPNFVLSEAVKWIVTNTPQTFNHFDSTIDFNNRKYNFEYFNPYLLKGLHRSGWQYVVEQLREYHNPSGTILDVYSDKTFGWKKNFFVRTGILPFKRSWVGIFHHTPNTTYSFNNLTQIVESIEFKKSMDKCVGIIVLSAYLKDWFTVNYPNLKVTLLYHPTQFPTTTFTIENYLQNQTKKAIQIGAWYRDSYAIYALPQPKGIQKCALKGTAMENYFAPPNYFEKIQDAFGVSCFAKDCGPCRICRQEANKFMVGLLDHLKEEYEKVEIIEKLSDTEYDEILSKNVVFIKLVDASACNTIIECIVRNTPIFVNKLPAVVEYLGHDYPLYYNDLNEARDMMNDPKLIEKAYKYLVKKDKSFLQISTFLKKFVKEV